MELRDWRTWVLAAIVSIFLTVIIGPIDLLGLPKLIALYFEYSKNGEQMKLVIDGWTEFGIFLVLIRILFGTEKAGEILQKIISKN